MGQEQHRKKIKEAREKAGLTQSRAGRSCRHHFAKHKSVWRGVRKPKYETLLKIAKALNVEWYSLFVATSDAELAEAENYLNFIRQQEPVWKKHKKFLTTIESVKE